VLDQSDVEHRQKTFSLKPRIEDEINPHKNSLYDSIAVNGRQVIEDANYKHEEVSERLEAIDEKWASLANLVTLKKTLRI
jgi:hypothetical protein